MPVAFSTISSLAHRDLKGVVPLPLSHMQQLFAAVLGYRNHAAYQAAVKAGVESESLADARHILPDVEMFERRAQDLHCVSDIDAVGASISKALKKALPEAVLHQSVQDLADEIRLDVETGIGDSSEFSSAQAETNGGMPWFDLEFEAASNLQEDSADSWALEVSGSASLELDEDRVYSGHEVSVSARVVFSRLGRRVLGPYEVDDVGAAVKEWRDDADLE